jgi:hypothetical protein
MSDYSILSRYFQRSPGIPLVYFLNQGSTMWVGYTVSNEYLLWIKG